MVKVHQPLSTEAVHGKLKKKKEEGEKGTGVTNHQHGTFDRARVEGRGKGRRDVREKRRERPSRNAG